MEKSKAGKETGEVEGVAVLNEGSGKAARGV